MTARGEADRDGPRWLTAGLEKHLGKVIETVRMRGDALEITFADDSGVAFEDRAQSCCEHRYMAFEDRAQSCCEHRYMTCDDEPELSNWIGARLLGALVETAPERDVGGDVHEVQFLRINTDLGTITCETHNENNGFYGGFDVVVREIVA